MTQINSLMTEKVLTTILENKDKALNKLDIESFHVYNFINEQYKETEDVRNNHLFQFTYRSFYRLDNAGLTPDFKKRYFELLQEYRTKEISLKDICIDLYEYKTRIGYNSVQFSFATKLANTIDASYPIYDSEVIKLFNFNQPYYLKDRDLKIDKYLEQYKYISSTSKELLLNKNIILILNSMNSIFGESSVKMEESKKLDTLMWAVGKVLNEK
ncbi:hypothetical protein [Poseidonibacter ostreae]|uniref:Uncharacterized protein n=1 Tax=Poseidonibacter ostreae TaxID=2654171 RepID=A0A6L4WTC9_9BACT|nr:hypothetical protein [Poseidonibacter ostreae]KAB7889539.1 hypothetical protein GBG19_05650 [Poseidonibacter ostreae]